MSTVTKPIILDETGQAIVTQLELIAEGKSPYVLPTANASTLGGVKAKAKTTETSEVAIDNNGKLWAAAGGGGGDLSAYRTAAAQDVIDAGKASSVHTHNAGEVSFDGTQTYTAGTVGAAVKAQSADIATLGTSKQDVISDLSTIRSGAALGATALQSVPNTYRTAAEQDAIHDNTKLGKPSQETYTISVNAWSTLASSSPFKYSAAVTATHTIANNTVCELINNQPVAFAEHGFSIGSVSGQTVTMYATKIPTASVTLTVFYTEV